MAASILSSEFDWDSGNWPKCGKHGVSREEIEQIFANNPLIFDDPFPDEPRKRAMSRAGEKQEGRYVFVVFTEKLLRGVMMIRPVSARYMHQKEIDYYEKAP